MKHVLLLQLILVTSPAFATPPIDLDENGQPRVVLIFAGSYGGGHDAPADAAKALLERTFPNVRVEIRRGQKYFRGAGAVPGVGEASTKVFAGIYQRAPRLWDKIFDRTVASAEGKTSAGDIPNPLFSKRRILRDIEEVRPDVIISTFHIMTSKLIGLRDAGSLNPEIEIAWLDTDFIDEHFYHLHSHGADLTFLAHPGLFEERLAAGVPADKMAVTGLFVDDFVREPFPEDARRAFLANAMSVPDRANDADQSIWINGRAQAVADAAIQLDPDVPTVTIASGRAGAGDYPAIVRGLVDEARARRQKIQIVAVCGENERNYDAITRMFRWDDPSGDARDLTLVASRLVDHAKLLRLMRSSQLFVGKPGSLTIFEAAMMGTPRVLIDVVRGQESWGADFFRKRGLAEVVEAHEQAEVGRRAFALLEDPNRLQRMRSEDQVVRDAYDPSRITEFVAEAVTAHPKKPPVRPPAVVPAAAPAAEPARRTVVIFSAGYGGGHNSSAQAMKTELEKADPNVDVMILYAEDYLRGTKVLPFIGRASTFVFNMVYQYTPGFWDWVFDKAIDSAEDQETAADIWVPLLSSRRMLADLRRIKPDVIYSTYHIATTNLIRLRRRGLLNPDIPIAWLDTDFVQKRFYYLHSHEVDQTFIAHPALRDERLDLGVPADKMKATGLFINPFVFQPFSDDERRAFMRSAMGIPDKAEAEKVDGVWRPTSRIWVNGRMQDVAAPAVDLDPDVMTVTIASGRAGVGDYATIIRGLVREARARRRKIQIVAVCGDNRKNYRAVTKLWEQIAPREGREPDVTLVASHLVDNMKLMKLVRSSQLFIGKSGSQSPFEAAAMGVPRVLIDIIGGQERHTAEFFRRQGLAEVVAADEQDSLAARAFAYLDDQPRMERMRAADQIIRDSYDLQPITRFYHDAVARAGGKPPVTPGGDDAAAPSFFRARCAEWLGRAGRMIRRRAR